MNAGAKLGAYGLVLAAALSGGAVAGSAADPIDVGTDATHETEEEETMSKDSLPAGGLLVSQNGYEFVPEDRIADAGEFAFTIVGPDGDTVVDFEEEHERNLHLIVASRDLTRFHHLHPTMDHDGRWSVDLPDLPAGAYRAFADFRPTDAEALTLGVDLTAAGAASAPSDLRPSDRDTVDGYDVRLGGDVAAGGASEVSVTVRKDGEIVTTDPYLGAGGHLVALRDGDLAYLHVHPLDDEPRGPVHFAIEVPSAGTYALFFDFLLDGEVHTARFVVEADHSAAPTAPAHGDSHE